MANPFIQQDPEPVLCVQARVTNIGGISRYTVLSNLEIRYGVSPNTSVFFVPFEDGEDTLNLPLPVTGFPAQDMVRIDLIGVNGATFSHYMFIQSYGFTRTGDKRGVTYNCVDYLRGSFLDKHYVFKNYNNVNLEDVFDPSADNIDQYSFGFWYTNEDGELIFKPNETADDSISASLIDAYYACIDIFYTPLRANRVAFPYPQLLFDPVVASTMRTFTIKETNLNGSAVLNGISEIVKQLSDKYDIFAWGEGFDPGDQRLLITRKGKGPQFVGTDLVGEANLSIKVRDNHMTNGYQTGERLAILKDESRVNYSKTVDAVIYLGAPRQFFVKEAPVIPAWDWWEDYNIIVRNSDNNRVIPPKLQNGDLNPAFPSWLTNWQTQFENLKNTFTQFSIDSEIERLSVFATISSLWGNVMTDFIENTQNVEGRIGYYINLVCMDALFVNPMDPIHQWRFKRYIAVKKDDFNQIDDIDRSVGWENDISLRRYKRILNTLVDGQRNVVSEQFISDLLNRTDTYELKVPPIIEGLMPGHFPSNKDKTLGVVGEQDLEWQSLNSVTIDSEKGFFLINNPKDVSVYFDRGKVRDYNGTQPLNYKNWWLLLRPDFIAELEAEGIVPILAVDRSEREGYYKTPYMTSGGVKGIRVESEYVPFRTKMRATFYYEAAQTHTDVVKERTNLNRDSWDIVDGPPSFNEYFLSGVVPDIPANADTRFAILNDRSMIHQSDEGEFSSSEDPVVQFLQSGTLRNLEFDTGKVYLSITWKHRRDDERLRDKAIRLFEELSQSEISGYIVVPEMLAAGSAGNVIFGDGIGLGSVFHNNQNKPISDISTSFPQIQSTIGFDFKISKLGSEYDAEQITKIRVNEEFRSISSRDKNTDRQKGSSSIESGSDPIHSRSASETITNKNYHTETGQASDIILGGNWKAIQDFAKSPAVTETEYKDMLVSLIDTTELGFDIDVTERYPDWDPRFVEEA